MAYEYTTFFLDVGHIHTINRALMQMQRQLIKDQRDSDASFQAEGFTSTTRHGGKMRQIDQLAEIMGHLVCAGEGDVTLRIRTWKEETPDA